MEKKRSHQIRSHQIRVWVAEEPPERGSGQPRRLSLGAAVSLLSAAVVVASGGWLALRLIVNPTALGGLSWLLPWTGSPLNPPLTVEAITAELSQSGWQSGPPLYLSTSTNLSPQSPGFQDWLLPVLEPSRSCGSAGPCQPIVELRVYRPLAAGPQRPGGSTYELIDRLTVTGPEEWAALAPLANANAAPQGSTRPLPLTRLSVMGGDAPLPGVWLQLSGEWRQGSRVHYGQLLHYDPIRRRLQSVQSWTSPVGYPRWQQVTGTAAPELVISHTLGLEPQFEVLQLRSSRASARSLEVEAIRLMQPALNRPAYTQALLLARYGLWSPALQQLQTLKSQIPSGQWPTAAQAQLDYIALHAQITHAQAERDWASPTQQILAQIIDGRWTAALNLLKTAHRSGYDVRNLLSANAERFWQRIEAGLRVAPRQSDLQQWGALVLTVRQDRQQAITWWQRQLPSSGTKPAIDTLLALLDPIDALPPVAEVPSPAQPAAVPVVAAPVVQPAPALAAPVARIIGTAVRLPEVTVAHWQSPLAEPLILQPGNVWYSIEVLEFHDGHQWRQSLDYPDTTGATLWQELGLANAQLQLISGAGTAQPETVEATVKAVQLQSGRLRLLAAARSMLPTNASPLLALTSTTVPWLPSAALPLAELAQQNPNWVTFVAPVWRELQAAQLVSAAAVKSLPTLQEVNGWTLQPLDLIGDQQPEQMWTIPTTTTAAGAAPFLTLITSSQGAVLYSSRWDGIDATVVGGVERHESTPAIIVGTAAGYRIRHWSSQNQQFE